MFKRIALALVAVLAAVLAVATPAQANTVHNCLDGSFCLYWDSNFGGAQTNQTEVAIMHATNQCWKLNSTWSNRTSSWIANFYSYDNRTVVIDFYDNTTCSSTPVYEGEAPQAHSSMGIYNDWLGSISLSLV